MPAEIKVPDVSVREACRILREAGRRVAGCALRAGKRFRPRAAGVQLCAGRMAHIFGHDHQTELPFGDGSASCAFAGPEGTCVKRSFYRTDIRNAILSVKALGVHAMPLASAAA